MVLAFKDVKVGMEVHMTPEGRGIEERRRGRVIQWSPEDCRLQLKGGAADGGVADLSQEWWDRGANAVLASSTLFHPVISPDNKQKGRSCICCCGVDKAWTPRQSFALLLAFLRHSVEETVDPSAACRHFPDMPAVKICCANFEAEMAMKRAPRAWQAAARRAFFGGQVRVLSVLVASVGPAEVLMECRALSGEVLAQLPVRPEDEVGPFLQRMEEMVSSTAAWCRLVLPDGRLLDEVPPEQSVAELLGSWG